VADAVAVLAKVFGSLFAAAALHELTHAVPAAVAGLRPRLERRGTRPVVTYDTPDRTVVAVAINAAPTAIGLAVAAVWIGVHGWPAVSQDALIGSVAWTLYVGPSPYDLLEPVDAEIAVRRKTKQVAACWAFAATGLLIYQSQAWLLGGYHAAVSQAGVGATVGSVAALLVALADV
jgi:hypothetical protein